MATETKGRGGIGSEEMVNLNDFRKSIEKCTQAMQRNLDSVLWIIEAVRIDEPPCLPGGFALPSKIDASLFGEVVSIIHASFQGMRGAALILARLGEDDAEEDILSPCQGCQLQEGDGCTRPCPDLEAALPKKTGGSGSGVRIGVFEGAATLRSFSSQDHWGDLLDRHWHYLTPKQLEVIELYYSLKLEIHEIGERIGVGDRAVRSLLERGRERLREARLEGVGIGLRMIRNVREER